MRLKHQKKIIICFLFAINLILSSTFIIYINYWYCYLFILALASYINASSCILNIGHKLLYKTENPERTLPQNYIYVMPCYNETSAELEQTLNSLVAQRMHLGDKRAIFIICDGMRYANNNICDISLKELLHLTDSLPKIYTYPTWDKKQNSVELHLSEYTHQGITLPVILLIKTLNYGKRDSLVLAREVCFQYNEAILPEAATLPMAETELQNAILNALDFIYSREKIKYMIGIDADTVFDYHCSNELIQAIDTEANDIYGCVGFVDISPASNFASPFILYQYAEYMFSQCLRRQTQSLITQKVSCLSGCVQILRIAEETCGKKILGVFNYLPAKDESIFNHIRSYASEDRNHVCNMLSLFPYVKTTQSLKAVAYTSVPTSLAVFLSQRRRWSLGANANDMLLVGLPGILLVERISAFVNVMTYSLSPFIFIATALFVKSIIENPTLLMLFLSIVLFIPFAYALIIVPLFIKPLSWRAGVYYYFAFAFFIVSASLVNLIIYSYSILQMDVISWGKTRALKSPTSGPSRNDDDDTIVYMYEEPISMYIEDDAYIEIQETSIASEGPGPASEGFGPASEGFGPKTEEEYVVV